MKKAAILAAGEGSRLKELNSFKPIIKINGTSLLDHTFKNLHFDQFQNISIILNDAHHEMDLSKLSCLQNSKVEYFFKSTQSSMHSLFEISKKLEIKEGEHFFVSMVDSIVPPSDAKKFHQFCQTLEPHQSALLVTSYIEDEKPLTLKINKLGNVSEFQCPIDDEVMITSGVYYFSYQVLPLLSHMIQEGQTKMRNFLSELVKRNHIIKIFHVSKTLDIDRPEDISSAENFLRETI